MGVLGLGGFRGRLKGSIKGCRLGIYKVYRVQGLGCSFKGTIRIPLRDLRGF